MNLYEVSFDFHGLLNSANRVSKLIVSDSIEKVAKDYPKAKNIEFLAKVKLLN